MKKTTLIVLVFLCIFFFQTCSDNDSDLGPIQESEKGLAAHWADITLYTIQYTPSNTPTFTSRNLGYIGLTMYESVVNGSDGHKSLVGQLSELNVLPMPATNAEYNWALSLNAGQASILKSLYPHAHNFIIDKIDSLESATYQEETKTAGNEVAERSVKYGRAVAEAIYEWSKTDGGHEGYLRNFDPAYVFPSGDSYWTPPTVGQSVSRLPLHPYWGNNRTFSSDNAALSIPTIAPFSLNTSSEHYKLFREVYLKRNSLTAEEKRIAAWWADDPTQSASPPGHSYNLATIAITSADADMFTAAEAYAKVGMAVADAFVCCWKSKYQYHSIRPYPFIKTHIDQDYEQFWPEPPFPSFPSGHSTQSAAAATALVSVFGANFPLVDNTYEKRRTDFENIKYTSRKFKNIQETASECAYSRFLGGIHTRQDNDVGATQGNLIGENLVNLSWKKQ